MTNSEYTKLEEIYGSQTLTEEEVKVAILREKMAKYFKERNAAYWAEKEAEKVKR